MKYIIAVGDNGRELTLEVNRYINDGYTPIGGVAISIEKGKIYYFQSMILDFIK